MLEVPGDLVRGAREGEVRVDAGVECANDEVVKSEVDHHFEGVEQRRRGIAQSPSQRRHDARPAWA